MHPEITQSSDRISGAGNQAFPNQRQHATKWCWIAIAVSIAKSYDASFARTQCELANELVPDRPPGTDCCDFYDPNGHYRSPPCQCDKKGHVGVALEFLNLLESESLQKPSASEAFEILQRGDYICFDIRTKQGFAHSAIVTFMEQTSDGGYKVTVHDPSTLHNRATFETWEDVPAKPTSGTVYWGNAACWSKTYITKKSETAHDQ